MAQPLGKKSAAFTEEEGKDGKDEQTVGDSKVGAEESAAADAAKDEGEAKEGAKEPEVTVGHGMVKGADERAEEIDTQAGKAVSDSDIELEPACLDSELAAVIAKEEAKAGLPPTPPKVRSISPMSVSRAASAELENKRAPAENSASAPSQKRARTATPPTSPRQKQKRRTDYLPLPSSLSHLVHPPTCTLYITNLRRPLVHSSLHEHLFTSSTPPGPSARLPPPRAPFAGESAPALWLSGVKDHAYATYPSQQDALEAAERIEGGKWPEDTGADLHVEFVQDDLVKGLVEEEEQAWFNGRQKLALKVEKDGQAESGYRFELTGGSGARGGMPMGRPGPGGPANMAPARGRPVAVPLSGTGPNAVRPGAPVAGNGVGPERQPPVNAPTGPSRLNAGGGYGNDRPGPGGRGGPDGLMSIRGRGGPGYGAPPHLARPPVDNGYGNRAARVGWGERDGNGPIRRTRERPILTWREGPGAKAARAG